VVGDRRGEQVLASVFKDRYLVAGVGVLVLFLSFVTAALAYMHTTNGAFHGLDNSANQQPLGRTYGNGWTTAEVRHYFDAGNFHIQCATQGYGGSQCLGQWGNAVCQKRYVGGVEGQLARHWVRWDVACPGQIHA
jgi:hypothetical protein